MERSFLLFLATLGVCFVSPAWSQGISVPTGTWKMVQTHGIPAQAVGWEKVVYAPGVKRTVMLSKYHQLGSEMNEAMVAYNFETNSWEALDIGGNFHTENLPEGGHSVGAYDYNPNNGTLIYRCCHAGANQVENPFHTWWFDMAGQVGLDKHTSPKPPDTALQPGGSFDIAHNVFVFHGGDSFVGTWLYDPISNSWTRVNTSAGSPPSPSLILASMTYSSAAQKVYLFGGLTTAPTNDLFAFDAGSKTWEKIEPAGGVKPSPRYRAGFAYDSTNNIFLLYGGKTETGDLGDTWVYDPVQNTWTQLNPDTAPPVPAGGPFERLAYDSDHNVFVLVGRGADGYADGGWVLYSIQTWLFRYAGTGPNAGTVTASAQPTPGSISRYALGWGKQPWLASSGSDLFAAWSELANPFDLSSAAWPHIYVSRYSGSSWTPLGTTHDALSTDTNEAHEPSITLVGNTPWVSWYEANNSATPAALYVKTWDGSQWTGTRIDTQSTGNGYPGRSHLATIGGVPHLAYLEVDKAFRPQRTLVYVKRWTGTSWALLGTGALNRAAAGSTAGSISMATDGSQPFVTWTEYVHDDIAGTDTNPQVYAAVWNGSAWIALGGSLNVDASAWAYDASVAVLGGNPYVAWTERTQAGNARLFVKGWNGSSWVLVGGGPPNLNTAAGWAFRPILVADATSNQLYAGWVEQGGLGQKPRAYVAQNAGGNGTWNILGGALNMDPQGAAQRIALAVTNTGVAAAWGEVNMGSMRHVYVRQWDGSQWTLLPGPTPDGTAPAVTIQSPSDGSGVSGVVTITASVTDNVGVNTVSFEIDGNPLGAGNSGTSSYSLGWDTTTITNGVHTITVIASDAAANTTKQSVSVTVNNGTAAPVITNITTDSITSTGVTIRWDTNETSDSQVAFGTTAAYGSMSALNSALVTSHSISLTGLSPATTYYAKALSRDPQGNLGESASFTFTTPEATDAMQQVFRIAGEATELAGTTSGSAVTPSITPTGFTGTLVRSGSGSVNFAPASSGTGVYFLTCCNSSQNAYYKFTGSSIGKIFSAKEGQVSFSLKSRYSFADRQNLASSPRYVYDVRDAADHQFYFLSQASGGALVFTYMAGGVAQYYYVPQGSEDALFGNGVVLNVTVAWDASSLRLYLNNTLVRASAYNPPAAMDWSSASIFDFGAYEYSTVGGFYNSDDVIDEFIVSVPPSALDTTPPVVSISEPAAGATVTGTVNISATATDDISIPRVDFTLDGTQTGQSLTAAPYSITWDSTSVPNGSHTIVALATDKGGNTSTSSVTVTVNNPVVAPVISGVSISSITATTAKVDWTTDKNSDSQVAYGTTTSYGSLSPVRSAMVTAHSVTLSGLTGSTTYNLQVLSRDAQGTLGSSGNFTFTTAPATSALQPVLRISGDITEVSGVTNASVVTPSLAPSGFTGTVVRNGSGSVNFTPAQAGTGVYFLNCCGNTNNAYYKFTGTGIGSIFTPSQGEITFSLKSRYSFSDRKFNNATPRYTFDVRDSNGHQFYFLTQVSSGSLMFTYSIGGVPQFYYVPQGTEDALFGNGVLLNVRLAWSNGNLTLSLNNNPVRTTAYSPDVMSWSATSVFNLGAYEYLDAGGYYISDDVIDEFAVSVPPTAFDNTPPAVSITSPAAGTTVTGTVAVSANASDASGIASVQFQADGNAVGSQITTTPYSMSWDTTTLANGSHTLAAIATDNAGLTATSTITVTVNNPVQPPTISGVSAGPLNATTATINWTTDKASDSQVAYGPTSTYGSLSTLRTASVTSHSVTLTGLAPSTTYNFQVLSRDVQGNLATSGNYTFTTTAASSGLQPLLQIAGDASELSGLTNGATVTPTIAPTGFTGQIMQNGTGSVNFAPAQTGNGVYFLNCCTNTNNAYYQFRGQGVGSIFNTTQGSISFSLKSRYSFAQRQAAGSSPRYVFDVRDSNGHQFYFLSQVSSGYLLFTWMVGGSSQFYYVPQGTEDSLFGNGVVLNVTLAWGNGNLSLMLNNNTVKTMAYTPATMSWTSASLFNLGAYEYLSAGGYYGSDDIIDEFTVASAASSPSATDTVAPVVSFTSPAAGATVNGTVSLAANASDNVGVAGVQFKVDGGSLGQQITTAPYTLNWDTTTATNGSHTITAVATDTSGNTANATISVTVSNTVAPTVVSGVSAGSITSSTATINWTTDKASDSQVAYGPTSTYGSMSTLKAAAVTSHSVTLSGLSPSTTYNYQVLSRDAQGNLATSGNYTFTTTASTDGLQPLLQIAGDASEVSGISNGSTVMPTIAPAGFTGQVVQNGTGSVNFAPAQTGNGVYFLNCCTNTNNAYYQFRGQGVGSIFNTAQGRISFSVKSRYSFAQRQAAGTSPRYVFDVRDSNGHQFYFLSQVSSGYLLFTWMVGGSSQFYYVPQGTEDSLFGSGVVLNVTLAWGNGNLSLMLNNNTVKTMAYTPATMSWTSASLFNLGAYEFLSAGGYYGSDDIIDEFTVAAPSSPSTTPSSPSTTDTVAPVVSFTSPAAGATVNGTVSLAANASDNVAVAGVQFKVDGGSLGQQITTAPYTLNWDTTTATNGSHTITAVATDTSGNTASATISVTVSNTVAPPVVSGVSAGSITSSTATINWTTDKASDSQVAYGPTSTYGSMSTLKTAAVTSHSVTLSGLSPSTTYNYQVLSRDAQGNLATSGNYTFTTTPATGGLQPRLQIAGDASELSGITNGSTVTPTIAPAGFTGQVVQNGTGSVNFAPAQTGNGVYFLNCCTNTNNAYYKFTGPSVGSIFNTTQGRISFSLKSRYSFAQRKAAGTSPRYVFDVRDSNGHQFYFLSQVSSGYLLLTWMVGGSAQFYYVPQGTEDSLFGNGAVLNVTLTWGNGNLSLMLNNNTVKTTAYTPATMSWTSASLFNLGAYEYLSAGGYYGSDDIIDEFTVAAP